MDSMLREWMESIVEYRLWQRRDAADKKIEKLMELTQALASRGDIDAPGIASEFFAQYFSTEKREKLQLFQALTNCFGPNSERLQVAADAFVTGGGLLAELELQSAVQPIRRNVFRRLNLAKNGTAQLVRMREDLLALLPEHPELRAIDTDFIELFTSWFNGGFLNLRRIDWHSSAAILEKIMQNEGVHRFNNWEDLRRRVDSADRRLYAFFHPALVDEPIVFVQVALTKHVPDDIGTVLTSLQIPIAANTATTAVFYSITNTHNGLRGIPFGGLLIKTVLDSLRDEFPNLRQFVTLSPAPNFRKWVEDENDQNPDVINHLLGGIPIGALEPQHWLSNSQAITALAPVIQSAATYYFLKARDKNDRMLDPVARFHLGNGAQLERINWPSDTSEKGLAQSYGLMVNYRYEPEMIKRNHEVFLDEGRVVLGSRVMKQAKALRHLSA